MQPVQTLTVLDTPQHNLICTTNNITCTRKKTQGGATYICIYVYMYIFFITVIFMFISTSNKTRVVYEDF